MYFFFINIEAQNDITTKNKKETNVMKSKDSNLRISIPVIPYSQ